MLDAVKVATGLSTQALFNAQRNSIQFQSLLYMLRSGDAQVTLEDGETKLMRQLRMGDRVQTVDSQGKLSFDDIFVFGEQNADSWAPYVELTLRNFDSDR